MPAQDRLSHAGYELADAKVLATHLPNGFLLIRKEDIKQSTGSHHQAFLAVLADEQGSLCETESRYLTGSL